jgi:hypothetical protein
MPQAQLLRRAAAGFGNDIDLRPALDQPALLSYPSALARGCAPPSEHEHGRILDPLSQRGMQTRARHDVGASAEYAGGALFKVDQLVKTDWSLLVIEKEIDVGVFPGLIAGGRTE